MNKNFFHAIFSIFIIVFVLQSCNKGPIQYVFEGKVMESVNNTSLAGVDVKLSQKLINNGVASETFTLATSGVTDNEGNYLLSIDRDKVTEFKLSFRKDNYFPLDVESSSSTISTEDNNVFNESLDAKSWMKFEIKNSFPEETDHLKLVTQTFREGCEGCAVNSIMDFYGPLDTTILYLTTGGVNVNFYYVIVSAASSSFESIYTIPFDTTTYTINY